MFWEHTFNVCLNFPSQILLPDGFLMVTPDFQYQNEKQITVYQKNFFQEIFTYFWYWTLVGKNTLYYCKRWKLIYIRLNAMARDIFLFVKIMRSTYGFHRSNCPNSWASILKSNIGSPRVSQLSLQTVSPILSQSLLLSSIIFENWTELYTVRSDKPLIFD